MSDPWAEAAKAYKPQSGQAPEAAGNDDWKVWKQTDAAEDKPGAASRFGSAALDMTGLPSLYHAFADPETDAEKSSGYESNNNMMGRGVGRIAKGIVQPMAEHGAQAIQAVKQGKMGQALAEGTLATPIIGPTMDAASDQYADKNYAGEAGTLGTFGAMAVMPKVMGEIGDAIPTRAKANKVFESLKGDLAQQPISLTRTQPQLARLLQLSKEGGGNVPTPIRQLANLSGEGTPKSVPLLRAMQNDLNGTTTEAAQPKPLMYPAARNFQSGIASMSRDDLGQMAGPMKGGVKQLSKAFYDDIHDATASAGRGDDYANAMKQFRQASQTRDFLKTAGKVGVPAVIGGGLLSKVLTSNLK